MKLATAPPFQIYKIAEKIFKKTETVDFNKHQSDLSKEKTSAIDARSNWISSTMPHRKKGGQSETLLNASQRGGQSETILFTSQRGGQSETLLNTCMKYQRF